MTRQIPRLRVFVEGVVIGGKLTIVVLFVGCAPATQRMVTRAATPDDTYSCYLQLLADMGYNRVMEADRSSGFIRVVRVGDTFGPEFRRSARNGVTVAISPASNGDGSDVSLAPHRVSMSRTGIIRFMNRKPRMNASNQGRLDRLSEACVR